MAKWPTASRTLIGECVVVAHCETMVLQFVYECRGRHQRTAKQHIGDPCRARQARSRLPHESRKRVAEIRPITDSGKSDLQLLMERADRMPKGETGHFDELLADKRASTSNLKEDVRWD